MDCGLSLIGRHSFGPGEYCSAYFMLLVALVSAHYVFAKSPNAMSGRFQTAYWKVPCWTDCRAWSLDCYHLTWHLVYPHTESLLQGACFPLNLRMRLTNVIRPLCSGLESLSDVPSNNKATAIIVSMVPSHFCECHSSIMLRYHCLRNIKPSRRRQRYTCLSRKSTALTRIAWYLGASITMILLSRKVHDPGIPSHGIANEQSQFEIICAWRRDAVAWLFTDGNGMVQTTKRCVSPVSFFSLFAIECWSLSEAQAWEIGCTIKIAFPHHVGRCVTRKEVWAIPWYQDLAEEPLLEGVHIYTFLPSADFFFKDPLLL